MSAEGYSITNPKDNNVDLEVTFQKSNGEVGFLGTIRPGEWLHVDSKKLVQVREITRPAMLTIGEDGSYVNDRRSRPNFQARIRPQSTIQQPT